MWGWLPLLDSLSRLWEAHALQSDPVPSNAFLAGFYLAYADVFVVLLMGWVFKSPGIISNLWAFLGWAALER